MEREWLGNRGDVGLVVAVGVFLRVAEGVEVLAPLLGGGLVGGECGFCTVGLAHVGAYASVRLRVGCGPGNLLQLFGVLRRQVDLDDGHRGASVGEGL